MPVVVAAVAAAVAAYWLSGKKPSSKSKEDDERPESPYQLERKLPDAMRERIVELLRRRTLSDEETTAVKQMAVMMAVPYPYASFALRFKLWEASGRKGQAPLFQAMPVRDARVLGYDPDRNYGSGAMADGTGPSGLDGSLPEKMAIELRERLRTSENLPVLSSYADELDKGNWPIAAETIRAKVNHIKRMKALAGEVVAGTYRLDHDLPADVRQFVEWSLDNNRRPEQLEAVALHFGRGYAWTSYQLRHRATQLRVGVV